MLIKKPSDIQPSEITPPALYHNRRRFLQTSAELISSPAQAAAAPTFVDLPASEYNTDEELTPYESVTSYNNFYEFGTGKEDPARYAGALQPRPWSVTVEGECAKPGVYDIEDFLRPQALEERIYRLRCVEAGPLGRYFNGRHPQAFRAHG